MQEHKIDNFGPAQAQHLWGWMKIGAQESDEMNVMLLVLLHGSACKSWLPEWRFICMYSVALHSFQCV